MFKLTDNSLHQKIIRNIHLYAPITNILLLSVQVFCYLLFALLLQQINGQQTRIPCMTKEFLFASKSNSYNTKNRLINMGEFDLVPNVNAPQSVTIKAKTSTAQIFHSRYFTSP